MNQPTPKQVRKLYKRVRFHMYQLQQALNEAHSKNVIRYPNNEFNAQAPCFAMGMLRDRVQLTTEKALAEAMRTECLNELKGVWY